MTTQYIRFNGRVSLIQFWQFNIVATIVIWGCTLLGSALSEVWENDLMYIAWIAHLLPILGMFVRRLHDCNMQDGGFCRRQYQFRIDNNLKSNVLAW